MNSILNYLCFFDENLCKNIKFCFRIRREIVSKLAKELYTNWGNNSYPYNFIYFHLFLFFHKINSILKNFNRLIFLSNFSLKNFCKKTRNFISDHNALISVFRFLIYYHIFIIYCEINLGTFSHSILYEKWRRKKCQKVPINFLVKGMTLHVAKKVIIIDI